MKSKIIQIRLPQDWAEAIDAEREERGQTISDFLREAAAKQLPRDVQYRLTRIRIGRPTE